MAKSPIPPRVLRRADAATRPFFRSARTLNGFFETLVGLELMPRDRARIVEQAIMLLENFHVNLPLKTAMYAVEPLRRLRLLQMKLSTLFSDDRRFHREMTQIYNSLNDIHTNYLLPLAFRRPHRLAAVRDRILLRQRSADISCHESSRRVFYRRSRLSRRRRDFILERHPNRPSGREFRSAEPVRRRQYRGAARPWAVHPELSVRYSCCRRPTRSGS